MEPAGEVRTVGRVAEEFGVTVRTLHHYDEIGLVRPSARSTAGYRLYTADDVKRLQHVVVYRRLGFTLEEIAGLVDGAGRAERVQHLRRQHAAVMSRLEEMRDLAAAVERALEMEMTGVNLTPEEQRELFGDGFSEDYAAEAESRWGDSPAWAQSRERTSRYTRADWEAVRAETEAVNAAFVAAMEAGEPPTSAAAMDAAEGARRQISERFYDLSPELHRHLADMYVSDPRFTRTYEDLRPGLARYVRDAIHSNADRAER